MGQKGRKHIEQHYNLDKQNDRLIEIYRSLLKQGSAFFGLLASLPTLLRRILTLSLCEIAWLPIP